MARKLLVIVGVFVGIVICVFFLGVLRSDILSGVRAYVGGESHWSKAQKRAVFILTRYANSHSEKDYQDYLAEIAVPLGDKQARLQLQQPRFDMRLVRDGFIQGRNSPDDVESMASLFRRFGNIGYMARAIAIWTDGDKYIGQLQELAGQLHHEASSPRPDPNRIQQLVEQVVAVDAQLTPLEDSFSSTLAEGARWINRVLSLATLIASALLLSFGIALSWAVLKQSRDSEEKYRNLINTANDAILVIDSETRVVLETNNKACEMLGISTARLVGLPESRLYPPNTPQSPLVPTSQGATHRDDLKLLRADGTLVPVEVNASATEFNGRPAILGIFRDIRERLESAKVRRSLEEQIRQSQKMEAVGRFAGGIAHDFNNLLMVIRGYSEIILQEASATPTVRKNVETIVRTSDSAANLTRQLLSFSRKHVFSPQVLELNSLVNRMSEMLLGLLQEEMEFLIKLAPDAGCVSVDPGQIEQVIMNLVVNARDAMPEGGILTLQTEHCGSDDVRRNLAAALPPGEYVMLSVSDTGVGMDAETQSRIFEPFFTTKKKEEGTGLGLSVVYNIVRDSSGHVRVNSSPGHGTTFQIFFPRVARVADNKPAAEGNTKQIETPALGMETVLVAEDQPDLRWMMCQFLQELGYSVLEAKDGSDALALAAEYKGQIDLLITDVVMPHVRGPEIARRMKAVRPDMKVIFMSGYQEGGFNPESIASLGIEPVLLQKPFELDFLAAKIRQVLGIRSRK